MSKDLTSIRVAKDTVELIKDLEVELWWVKLASVDDKLNHLVWFFKHYKNNNWK